MMLNTEAESVDDMVAASKMAKVSGNVMASLNTCPMPKMKKPVNTVVSSTPTVESVKPGPRIGLMSLNLVPIPPVNNMIVKAIMPMNCAML